MRRTVAAATLAVGLLTAAACGSDNGNGDDGGKSTEEVCNELSSTMEPLQPEVTAGLAALGQAAAEEDDAALAAAAVEFQGVVGQVTGAYRGAANDASDQGFSDALNGFADEIENLAESTVGGEAPDLTALSEANEAVEVYCEI